MPLPSFWKAPAPVIAVDSVVDGVATLFAVDDADDPAQASNLVVLRVVLA